MSVDAADTTVYSYTAGNQLLTEDGPFASNNVTSTYINRLRTALSLQQPTGSWTNGLGYDSARRLTNVISPAGTFNYTYVSSLPSLLVRKLALPNTAFITNNFDSVARLLDTSLKNSSGTTLDSYAYVYDPANERTNLTRLDNSTVAFTYDKIGQLTIANSISQLTVANSSVNSENENGSVPHNRMSACGRRRNNGQVSLLTLADDISVSGSSRGQNAVSEALTSNAWFQLRSSLPAGRLGSEPSSPLSLIFGSSPKPLNIRIGRPNITEEAGESLVEIGEVISFCLNVADTDIARGDTEMLELTRQPGFVHRSGYCLPIVCSSPVDY